jgi:hypothetical protein
VNNNDQFEAGLIAAMHALDALADTYAAEAKAVNSRVGEDDYDPELDTRLTYRYVGVVDAYGSSPGWSPTTARRSHD